MNLLLSLYQLFRCVNAFKKSTHVARLKIEQLESRLSPSVTATLNGSTLQIEVTSGDTASHTLILRKNVINSSTQTEVLADGGSLGSFVNADISMITVVL